MEQEVSAESEEITHHESRIIEKEHWERIRTDLRKSVGEDAFRRWFEGAELSLANNGVARLTVAGEMHQVWIEANFLPQVRAVVADHLPTACEIRVQVPSSITDDVNGHADGPPSDARLAPRQAMSPVPNSAEKRLKNAGLNPSFTFESFVVGGNSQFAHAACEAVARKAGIGYNPLFIHGGPGLGKTHLMHSIGQEILKHRPSERVVYLTCERFTNEFIDAVSRGDMEKFRRKYRGCDVLLLDDVQFLASKERSQQEFFHTFNTLMDGRCQVVLTSDRPASEIKNLEPRLVSRFECGLTVELQPPQMETRLAILRQKAKAWNVRLDDAVMMYLAEKIRTNVRRLEGALMRVATYASLAGEAVDVGKIEHLLRDLIREESGRQITIDSIQKAVAEFYDVRLADMTSRRRPASIAFPRQIAMYLSRSLTKGSLIEIGEAFGGRDHGTVIHACRKVADLIDTDAGLKDALHRIEAILRR